MKRSFSVLFALALAFSFLQLTAQTQIASAQEDNTVYSADTFTRHVLIPAGNLGRGPTNPPVVDTYGICMALEFTVDTDKAYHKFHVPSDWVVGTDIVVLVHWTRSSTGANDNGKTVKWQIKYLFVDGTSMNVDAGENTISVQTTYASTSTDNHIVYTSDNLTIPGSELTAGYCAVIELMAITPTGTALSEPACPALGITYTAYTAYYEERSGLWVVGAVALGLAVFAIIKMDARRRGKKREHRPKNRGSKPLILGGNK